MARPSGYLRTSAFCFDCHSAIKLISEIFSRDYFGISGNLSCAIKIGYYREVTGWLCTNPGDSLNSRCIHQGMSQIKRMIDGGVPLEGQNSARKFAALVCSSLIQRGAT
ncbi:hypothetical protein HPP92_020835 [Vanilla planifolia]|uniref:Uncharacterized protein n=1 Tax=Vanilla planifolia TaxID=51239 RepID=A0A835UGJ9_VANPL|nr:hypothetical protein HPP92_020835 [Vanilla planifolia]